MSDMDDVKVIAFDDWQVKEKLVHIAYYLRIGYYIAGVVTDRVFLKREEPSAAELTMQECLNEIAAEEFRKAEAVKAEARKVKQREANQRRKEKALAK